MMNEDIDDGRSKPIGYVSDDGELEVVEDVENGKHYRETELGQHMRWMRHAQDLYTLYQHAIERIRVLETQATTNDHPRKRLVRPPQHPPVTRPTAAERRPAVVP